MILTGPIGGQIPSSSLSSHLKCSRVMGGFYMLDSQVLDPVYGDAEIDLKKYGWPAIQIGAWTKEIFSLGSSPPYDVQGGYVADMPFNPGDVWNFSFPFLTSFGGNPYAYSDLGTPDGVNRGPNAEKRRIVGKTAGVICWYASRDLGFSMSSNLDFHWTTGNFWSTTPIYWKQITADNNIQFDVLPADSPSIITVDGSTYSTVAAAAFYTGRVPSDFPTYGSWPTEGWPH